MKWFLGIFNMAFAVGMANSLVIDLMTGPPVHVIFAEVVALIFLTILALLILAATFLTDEDGI